MCSVTFLNNVGQLLPIFQAELYIKVKQDNCFERCDITLLQCVFLESFAEVCSIVTDGMLQAEV